MKKRKACQRGHPFDEANTLLVRKAGRPQMQRQCRTCARERTQARYQAVDRVKRSTARLARIEAWKRAISPAELAWAAGHFEGEGTISISAERRNGYARPLASLASTDREVIELFSAWWPTSIAGKKARYPTANARAVFRWEINSAVKVRAFIDQIQPYLRTVRCRAKFELVGEFTDKVLAPHVGKTKQRHPEYIELIRRLNHRGSAPFVGKTVLEQVQEANMLPAIG